MLIVILSICIMHNLIVGYSIRIKFTNVVSGMEQWCQGSGFNAPLYEALILKIGCVHTQVSLGCSIRSYIV